MVAFLIKSRRRPLYRICSVCPAASPPADCLTVCTRMRKQGAGLLTWYRKCRGLPGTVVTIIRGISARLPIKLNVMIWFCVRQNLEKVEDHRFMKEHFQSNSVADCHVATSPRFIVNQPQSYLFSADLCKSRKPVSYRAATCEETDKDCTCIVSRCSTNRCNGNFGKFRAH